MCRVVAERAINRVPGVFVPPDAGHQRHGHIPRCASNGQGNDPKERFGQHGSGSEHEWIRIEQGAHAYSHRLWHLLQTS